MMPWFMQWIFYYGCVAALNTPLELQVTILCFILCIKANFMDQGDYHSIAAWRPLSCWSMDGMTKQPLLQVHDYQTRRQAICLSNSLFILLFEIWKSSFKLKNQPTPFAIYLRDIDNRPQQICTCITHREYEMRK
jgi:hypothetical protein